MNTTSFRYRYLEASIDSYLRNHPFLNLDEYCMFFSATNNNQELIEEIKQKGYKDVNEFLISKI